MNTLHADLTISMSDFKKNPAKVLREAGTRPVAVLNHNKPAFYMVDPVLFEALLDKVADVQLIELLRERIANVERNGYIEVDLASI